MGLIGDLETRMAQIGDTNILAGLTSLPNKQVLGTVKDFADFTSEVDKANSRALKCALESILATELRGTSRG